MILELNTNGAYITMFASKSGGLADYHYQISMYREKSDIIDGYAETLGQCHKAIRECRTKYPDIYGAIIRKVNSRGAFVCVAESIDFRAV